MTIILSVIGILLAFGVLIFAAYKKISMFLAAVLAAAIVALFGGLDVAASLVGAEGPFLVGMKNFVGSWLVIFAMGALLGALYDKSGATWRISSTLINKAGTQWTLLIYVLVGGLLVYGGIQVTVMIFVLLPFAKILFPKAGIPWFLASPVWPSPPLPWVRCPAACRCRTSSPLRSWAPPSPQLP